jgi:hypothetical protein
MVWRGMRSGIIAILGDSQSRDMMLGSSKPKKLGGGNCTCPCSLSTTESGSTYRIRAAECSGKPMSGRWHQLHPERHCTTGIPEMFRQWLGHRVAFPNESRMGLQRSRSTPGISKVALCIVQGIKAVYGVSWSMYLCGASSGIITHPRARIE